MTVSTVRIGVLLPELAAVGGDGGNAIVLAHRLRARGLTAEIVEAGFDEPIPSTLDLYVLGGPEDPAPAAAAAYLRRHPGLSDAVQRGVPVLATGVGMQVLGHRLIGPDGTVITGAGLLDLQTAATDTRGTGETVLAPDSLAGLHARISGFANRTGAVTLGPAALPLGAVTRGIGNDPRTGSGPESVREGAVHGSILATGLHGPVLARNPEIADHLLTTALGLGPGGLAPLEMATVDRLRAERIAAAG